MDNEKRYNIIMDALMVILTGYYVFMTIDDLTDGKLRTELSMKLYKIKGRIKEEFDREHKFNKYRGAVIFDAITTVEDSDNSGGTASTN